MYVKFPYFYTLSIKQKVSKGHYIQIIFHCQASHVIIQVLMCGFAFIYLLKFGYEDMLYCLSLYKYSTPIHI